MADTLPVSAHSTTVYSRAALTVATGLVLALALELLETEPTRVQQQEVELELVQELVRVLLARRMSHHLLRQQLTLELGPVMLELVELAQALGVMLLLAMVTLPALALVAASPTGSAA